MGIICSLLWRAILGSVVAWHFNWSSCRRLTNQNGKRPPYHGSTPNVTAISVFNHYHIPQAWIFLPFGTLCCKHNACEALSCQGPQLRVGRQSWPFLLVPLCMLLAISLYKTFQKVSYFVTLFSTEFEIYCPYVFFLSGNNLCKFMLNQT